MARAGIGSPTIPVGRGAGVDDFHALVAAIETSPILVGELSAAALGQVLPGDVALDRTTPVASWASRYSSAEIDAEVLRWIASHVKSKKRLGGPLMTIAALLVGASISPVAASLVTVVDLLT